MGKEVLTGGVWLECVLGYGIDESGTWVGESMGQ